MTEAALRRTMTSAEFTQWQAYYDLRGRVEEVQRRHPNWSLSQVLKWVRAMEELAGRKR